MPKHTFKQLHPDKQERILRTAAVLFAERGFHKTDVAEIANRAGVAKGSLYNYFSSKDDLYINVCRDGLERSRTRVFKDIDPDLDIFEHVRQVFTRGAAFAREHPEYVRLYLNVSSTGMERFAEELTYEVEEYASNLYKRVIARDIKAGRVRPDADPSMCAFTINTLYLIFLASLVSRHYELRIKEYLDIEGDLNDETVDGLLARIFALMERLMAPVDRSKMENDDVQ